VVTRVGHQALTAKLALGWHQNCGAARAMSARAGGAASRRVICVDGACAPVCRGLAVVGDPARLAMAGVATPALFVLLRSADDCEARRLSVARDRGKDVLAS